MLDMMAFLNKLNHNADGLKVSYDIFHLNELSEMLDIRFDYVLWLQDQNVSTRKLEQKNLIVKLFFRRVNCICVIIHFYLTLMQKWSCYKLTNQYRFVVLKKKCLWVHFKVFRCKLR